MTNDSINWIEENLWPRGERRDIWAILDAARDRTIFGLLLECRLEYSCLYSGYLPPALEIAAPYLVQLEYQHRYTRRILDRAWGQSWGIFLKCDLNLDRLRRHLRHLLVARDTRGNNLVFRYYDPRVLRVYLPTCVGEELRSVFGPVQLFWTEGQSSEELLEFRLQRGGLVRRTLFNDSRKPAELWPPGTSVGPSFDVQTPQRYTPLMIRQAQLAAFSQAELQKFETWTVAHLNRFFPRQCKSAGEEQLRETIRYGVGRAASYGITTKRDVCKYIDLMIVFGRDFDTDKRSRWAGRILADRRSPGVRMQALLQAAKVRLRNR